MSRSVDDANFKLARRANFGYFHRQGHSPDSHAARFAVQMPMNSALKTGVFDDEHHPTRISEGG
jgi:hypothetical protein